MKSLFRAIVPLTLVALLGLGVVSCDNGPSGKMTTFHDSVSYAIGMNFGKGMKESNETQNLGFVIEHIIAGIRDASGDGETRLTDSTAQMVTMNFQMYMQTQAMDTTKSDSTTPTASSGDFSTLQDSISYVVGMNLGGELKDSRETDSIAFNFDLLISGIQDAYSGDSTQLTDSVTQAVMVSFQTKMQEKVAARSAKEGSANLEIGNAFLAENRGKEGVQVTESGLQYVVNTEGSGTPPGPADEVTVEYAGRLIDGTEFDASAPGNPVAFPVGGVIPGWTEALQLMKPGAEWTLFLPSDIAYGPTGSPPAIGPNSVLVFDVKLISVARK